MTLNKAVILAAGKGTRLYPLTLKTPKCLLKVYDDTSILSHQLQGLKYADIKNVTIVTGFEAQQIEDEATKTASTLGIDVQFTRNEHYEKTNSSYSLWLAREFVRDGFLYLNSDLMVDHGIMKNTQSVTTPFTCVDTERSDSDMVRSTFKNGSSLLHSMGKGEAFEKYDSVIVGPFGFDAEATAKIIAKMDKDIKNDEWKHFCYLDFAELINDAIINVESVDLANKKWIEIDTEEELLEARTIFS